MRTNKLIVAAFVIGVALISNFAHAQQTSIANIAPPSTGSTSLSFGDIVPATRGGTPGSGGGTTYGLLIGFGGTCSAGQYVYYVSPQGVPSCSNPSISTSATFTVASGCGTVGAVSGGGTAGTFTAGQTGCIPVINLPTAAHGWICTAFDITHPADLFTQTAVATTSCTVSATVSNSDVIVFTATGF